MQGGGVFLRRDEHSRQYIGTVDRQVDIFHELHAVQHTDDYFLHSLQSAVIVRFLKNKDIIVVAQGLLPLFQKAGKGMCIHAGFFKCLQQLFPHDEDFTAGCVFLHCVYANQRITVPAVFFHLKMIEQLNRQVIQADVHALV